MPIDGSLHSLCAAVSRSLITELSELAKLAATVIYRMILSRHILVCSTVEVE